MTVPALVPLLLLGSAAQVDAPPSDLPRVRLEREDQEVRASCVLLLPEEPLVDTDDDGVVHVIGGGGEPLHVVFEGHLRGAPADAPPDSYSGIGVRATGPDVRLWDARVSGFRVGIEAVEADGLRVLSADVSDNRRARLGSTWEREDAGDWLYPHANDQGQWKREHGAGLVVERSARVEIDRLRAREVQNGILLDRVDDSRVLRSDASFLSGWGLALWRSNENHIRGNRFEFCIRGYAHGRYNRGQDSAGLLMFEQCSGNLVELNSITHSGDGVFGFAGSAALGQDLGPDATLEPRLGCNDNRFVANDLSFAAAHGLELTFSHGNRIDGNLFEGNAICGVWLGYGRDSLIRANRFVANGDAGYGAERGAINAEHARRLVVADNLFERNALGLRLWSDADEHLRSGPWAAAHGMDARDNRLVANTWADDAPRLELVDAARTRVGFALDHPGLAADAASRASLERDSATPPELAAPAVPAPSVVTADALEDAPAADALRARVADAHGVPAALDPDRSAVPDAGRAAIVMTEWGPYDWTTPFVQPLERRGDLHRYRLLGPNSLTSVVALEGGGEIDLTFDKALPRFPVGPDGLARGVVRVRPRARGRAVPYRLVVRARGADLPVSGLLFAADWDVRWFASPVDPRDDLEAWRAAAEEPAARAVLGDLSLDYGGGGPTDLARARGLDAEVVEALEPLGADGFGTVARTTLTLPAGTWRVSTRSDDGLRVTVDERALIEDWTWHAPREHTAEFTLDAEREVRLAVEHFELDGHSTLELELDRAD